MSEVEPVTIVIFGGAGDLAHRKLLPALYNLHVDKLLPLRFAVVGVGRRPMSDDEFRAVAKDGTTQFSRRPPEDAAWATFAPSLHFVNASLDDESGFRVLGSKLDTIEHEAGLPGNRIYYLALPPTLFASTVQQMSQTGLIRPLNSGPFSRVIIEKPIGHDLESACAINDALAAVLDEHQIYRIDHYLGKETVQNILVLRFANSFFEPLFNQKYIDHVQITVAESEGVGTRAGYYENAGALRDMVQNHILQLVALVGMEPPRSLDANVVRDERLEVIRSLRPLSGEAVDTQVVRAQYGASADGETRGYRDAEGVDPASRTETFVALQIAIDDWRWAGVPIFLRTGKRLPKRASEISVHMKPVPPILFNANPAAPLEPNVLSIRIQPNEGFALTIESKLPGPHVHVQPVKMDFQYGAAFNGATPEAYERLLLDVMAGDPTLFMRRDAVEASWRWLTPILERWREQADQPIPAYPAGEWGPPEADRLIQSTGRKWRNP
jgi:glucose-6-phosphate 1-dehydrogenase